MHNPLSKADRLAISNSVKNQFSGVMAEIGFVRCKASSLWSRDQDECVEYIRLKRTSTFSEWPHFQINFGFTPKFTADIKSMLEPILKTNQPMYEIWSHHVISLSEHHRSNTKGVFSSAEPGTWEFRNLKEVERKIEKISVFIATYFSVFISSRMNDEFISSIGLRIIDELPPSFRVLQIISFGNLQDLTSIERSISYYKNSNFGKKGSCFKKPVEKYGEELFHFFKHHQTDHPHSRLAR